MAADSGRVLTVWRVDLRQPDQWIEEAGRILAPDEREQAARGAPAVRRRRVVARAALRIALARALERPAAELTFVLAPSGKPELASREVEFSVSTSGDLGVVAVTDEGSVGVDVELVVPRAGLDRIVETRFAPAEAEAIARLGGESRLRAFYNCWTRKEAYLKATGAGLRVPLNGVVVSVDDERPAIISLADGDPGDWSIAALDLGAEAVGALALQRPQDQPFGPVEVVPLPLAFT